MKTLYMAKEKDAVWAERRKERKYFVDKFI
jgi:hypothetical protein